MGWKISGKKKKKTTMPDQALQWMPSVSVVEDKHLQELVDKGFLPCKELAKWKSVHQEAFFPSEDTGETIVYTSFFERGLGLPASKFLRGLLHFYDIELFHLNPKGISHIALFVHMCEAFLGINPHFQLFRYFFRLKPFPNSKDPNVCGGAGFQLRQSTRKEYFDVSLKDPGRNWNSEWFIIGDVAPQLPVCSGRKPAFTEKWNDSPTDEESIHIEELVTKIANLKEQGLTAAGIAWSFIKRRTQPLQERSVPGYLYKGPEDPSRLKKEDLTHDEILERVRKLLNGVNSEPKTPNEYSATKPPPPENINLYHSPSPLPEHLTADQTAEAEISGSKEQAKAATQSSSGSKRPVEEGRLQVQVPKKKRIAVKFKIPSDNVTSATAEASSPISDISTTDPLLSEGRMQIEDPRDQTDAEPAPASSPPVEKPEPSRIVPEALSAGMQIKALLQDLQGPSPDVIPLGSLCFEFKQYKKKPVSIAAASPMMTAAVPPSAEASQHPTTSEVAELSTRPSDNVSAIEDKMPEGLPTLVEQVGQVAVAESQGEVLQIQELQKKLQFYLELSKKNSALLKHCNQLLTRAESAEAKLAEKQERSAKLKTCHLSAIAVLEEQIHSLKKENAKILTSLEKRAQTETRLKEQLTDQVDRCKKAKNQLCQALQREADLKRVLDSEQNKRKETYSQLFTCMEEIQTLNTSLDKAEAEKEEIKVAATPILKVVSRLSENQASTPFLDQLREVPGLIQEYCKKAARVCTSRVLGTVRAYYPNLDLTQVGEGKPKDCSAEDFASHIVAMDPVADSLIESFTL